MRLPHAVSVLLVLLGSLAAQPGQQPAAGAASAQERVERARQAMQKWIDASDERERLLDRTVESLLAAARAGLAMLAEELAAAQKQDDGARTGAIRSLVGHVAHRWLGKVEKSEMVFAGQYGDLALLMPDVGSFYLGLLLETPEWFPITDRVKVVAALRDLYPKGPGRVITDRVEAMAADEREPDSLRVALSYALAQWGNRKFVRSRIAELDRKARDEDTETAILALRDLAAIYYGIRDYAVGALTSKGSIGRADSVCQ